MPWAGPMGQAYEPMNDEPKNDWLMNDEHMSP